MYEIQNCDRAGADIRGVGALAIFRNRQHVSLWTFRGNGGDALLTSRIDNVDRVVEFGRDIQKTIGSELGTVRANWTPEINGIYNFLGGQIDNFDGLTIRARLADS